MKKTLGTVFMLLALLMLPEFMFASGLTDGANKFKEQIYLLVKVIAAIGLAVIIAMYLADKSSTRSIPWGWLTGAVLFGASETILGWFGLA